MRHLWQHVIESRIVKWNKQECRHCKAVRVKPGGTIFWGLPTRDGQVVRGCHPVAKEKP